MLQTLRTAALGLVAALALSAPPATAAELAAPEGEPILTVSGEIAHMNADGAALFDRAMLAALPVTEITTTTIWTEGAHRFTGVELKALLDAVGARGAALRAVALNDYSVTIPAADAVEGGPIVAYLMDGEEMSVREKGPLWIVYPYDARSEYRTETIYSRSIWQLSRLEIVE